MSNIERSSNSLMSKCWRSRDRKKISMGSLGAWSITSLKKKAEIRRNWEKFWKKIRWSKTKMRRWRASTRPSLSRKRICIWPSTKSKWKITIFRNRWLVRYFRSRNLWPSSQNWNSSTRSPLCRFISTNFYHKTQKKTRRMSTIPICSKLRDWFNKAWA